MSQERKNFLHINESFECQHCGHLNQAASSGCRNHCTQCLYSLHVDTEVPGDRESDCHGLMKPVSLDYDGKKGYIVVHECQSCGKRMRNKAAPDDHHDLLVELSTRLEL
jgi:Zn ribbon nucleic-acid-binding protein